MGNVNDRQPDQTYRNDKDMLLWDVINNKRRYAERGDMIQYHRGRYEHWAIYIGDGRVVQVTVQEFGNPLKTAVVTVALAIATLGEHTAVAIITEESFQDVLGADGKARINNFKDKQWKISPPDEIVERARNSVGKEGYHVLANNCEHFATSCRYGVRLSGQEEAFWSTATLGAYRRRWRQGNATYPPMTQNFSSFGNSLLIEQDCLVFLSFPKYTNRVKNMYTVSFLCFYLFMWLWQGRVLQSTSRNRISHWEKKQLSLNGDCPSSVISRQFCLSSWITQWDVSTG